MLLVWMWESDPDPLPPVDIGSLEVPDVRDRSRIAFVVGDGRPASGRGLALSLLRLLLSLSLDGLSGFLATEWRFPAGASALIVGALLIVGSVSTYAASIALRHGAKATFALLLVAAVGAVAVAPASDAAAHWQAGLRPDASGYAAMVYQPLLLQIQIVAAVAVVAGFALARLVCGKLDQQRRAVFDNLALLLHYSVAQGLFGLLLVRGFPGVAQP